MQETMELNFDGPAYDKEIDQKRLSSQHYKIFDLMKDGAWRTLPEIERATGAPAASISAQLRHLRKERFGAHTIQKIRSSKHSGLWEYRLCVSTK